MNVQFSHRNNLYIPHNTVPSRRSVFQRTGEEVCSSHKSPLGTSRDWQYSPLEMRFPRDHSGGHLVISYVFVDQILMTRQLDWSKFHLSLVCVFITNKRSVNNPDPTERRPTYCDSDVGRNMNCSQPRITFNRVTHGSRPRGHDRNLELCVKWPSGTTVHSRPPGNPVTSLFGKSHLSFFVLKKLVNEIS